MCELKNINDMHDFDNDLRLLAKLFCFNVKIYMQTKINGETFHMIFKHTNMSKIFFLKSTRREKKSKDLLLPH